MKASSHGYVLDEGVGTVLDEELHEVGVVELGREHQRSLALQGGACKTSSMPWAPLSSKGAGIHGSYWVACEPWLAACGRLFVLPVQVDELGVALHEHRPEQLLLAAARELVQRHLALRVWRGRRRVCEGACGARPC